MNKNDKFRIEIEDMSNTGEGIGKVDGYTVFVKDAVIGDVIEGIIIKAKKNYGFGKMTNIVKPSPFRVTPKCPVARQCGGCQIQALSYEKQLEYKLNKVKGNLERIGKIKDYTLEGIIGMDEPYHYRNKAQYPVGRNKDGKIVIGFYAGRTHSIIENERCYLGHPVNETILNIVKKWMETFQIQPYDEKNHTGLVRHILIRVGFRTGQIMVCLIVNGRKVPHMEALAEELLKIEGMSSISYNINTDKTNVILGNQCVDIYGPGYIEDMIGEVKFRISPLSFYQVNAKQTEKLYRKALEYANLTGNETVWDMYCGIGTISLFLAKNAKKVYGVEIIPEAIEDARVNAKINGIENTEFFVGKAEEVVPEFFEKNQGREKTDVVVVDPPRKGCDEVLLNTLVKMMPERIVYVSCDSATLARDLEYLEGKGYKVEKVCVVDQFAHSCHVECVTLLQRKDI